MQLLWQNIGTAPTYERWNVMFELRDSSGAVAWSGKSSHELKLFQPSSSSSAVVDTFSLPESLSGRYSLHLVVRDPNGYRKPLPLAIRGVQSDGSYLLNSNVAVP